jgi:hypothetical protein
MARRKGHLEALLKPEERAMAAEAQLISLEGDAVDEAIHQAWVDELERRLDANAEGIPAEDVFEQGRARLRKLS